MRRQLIKNILLAIVLTITISSIVVASQLVKKPQYYDTSANSAFLAVKGTAFDYQGQTVYLRGTNFWNMVAFSSKWADSGDYVWGPDGTVDDIPIREDWYAKASELNANVIRFTLDFAWYNDGTDSLFRVLDQHVEYARKYNLWIIWDMHTAPGECYEGYSHWCDFWNTSQEQELVDFWVEMAQHYKDEPVVAGYGLLNEPLPPGPDWESTWYELAQVIINEVRKVDTNHPIFVMAGSDGNFPHTFSGGNIVYEVHYYEPGPGTHCQDNKGKYTYPGNIPTWWPGDTYYWSKSEMAKTSGYPSIHEFIPLNWSMQNNVPLFIGEFGMARCTNGADQYNRDLAEVFNGKGLHYTNWVWNGGYNNWGMFPDEGPMTSPHTQEGIEAMRAAWANNFRPNFSGPGSTYMPSPTPIPTPTPNTSIVSSITTASGKTYYPDIFNNTIYTYIDRSYKISSAPQFLAGSVYIRTANDDKLSQQTNHLTFTLNASANVYVAYDPRLIIPSWLTSWENTGMTVNNGDGESLGHKIYKKAYTAGSATLGGNYGIDKSSMYLVMVEPAASTPTNSPSPSSSPQVTCSTVDFNSDGKLNILDYSFFFENFGKAGADPRADLNSDGKVNIIDYVLFFDLYRACP